MLKPKGPNDEPRKFDLTRPRFSAHTKSNGLNQPAVRYLRHVEGKCRGRSFRSKLNNKSNRILIVIYQDEPFEGRLKSRGPEKALKLYSLQLYFNGNGCSGE